MQAPTYGLSHIALKVKDLDRAVAFYQSAFGAKQYLIHFGLRLTGPERLDEIIDRVLAAGGTVTRRGDFGDNQPFAFVRDPDGYEIELWHENTPHHFPK